MIAKSNRTKWKPRKFQKKISQKNWSSLLNTPFSWKWICYFFFIFLSQNLSERKWHFMVSNGWFFISLTSASLERPFGVLTPENIRWGHTENWEWVSTTKSPSKLRYLSRKVQMILKWSYNLHSINLFLKIS